MEVWDSLGVIAAGTVSGWEWARAAEAEGRELDAEGGIFRRLHQEIGGRRVLPRWLAGMQDPGKGRDSKGFLFTSAPWEGWLRAIKTLVTEAGRGGARL